MFKKVASFLIIALLHLVAVGVLVYAFWPVARWYIAYRPLWGVDFFLTATITKLLSLHFVAPFAFWNYAGFSGWPAYIYPSLHAYFAFLFSRFFDLISAIQIWVMVCAFLFVLGSYFLFFALSRNVVISALLAIGVAYSGGVYQTLTWAGSLPSFATQAAFPWTLFFLVLYARSAKMRQLLAAALIAGISIWGHPLVFVVYIVPAVFILVLFRFNNGLAIVYKIKTVFVFLLVALLVGFPLFAATFKNTLQSAVRANYGTSALSTTSSAPVSQAKIDVANFNKAQVKRFVTDNNILPFVMLGLSACVFLLSFVAIRRRRLIIESLPFAILAAYFIFYIWLFGQGISIYHGGWYRLFWSVPVWVGALASVLWGEALGSLSEFIKNKVLKLVLFLGTNLVILVIGAAILYVWGAHAVFVSIDYRSQVSSAYPDIINIRVGDKGQEELKRSLLPSWMNGDETNFRLYDGDQTVNIWWNSLFAMPLARGYIDPPITNSQRGFIFLLDSALSESQKEPQLVKVFKYPLETAVSNALFLIDWNGIKFYEGGNIASNFLPVPKHLKDILVKRDEIIKIRERYTRKPQELHFYEFKDDLTSPILSATNASTIGVFASDTGFETVLRAIAESGNVNSQKLIPVKLGKFIDNYNLEDLKKFDGLYLYDYDYKKEEKTFKLLSNYLQLAKNIFIDTGVEVKQSSGALPEIFPVKQTVRKGMGKDWEIENPDRLFGEGVDFKKFSPLDYDNAEWNVSFAEDSKLNSGAKVILKNRGKVVMASQKIGDGELVWSGINLAYHLNRNHNLDESRFFLNILGSLVDLSKRPVPNYKVTFKNSNERIIETEGASGILFKEMAYPGWKARRIDGDKKLKPEIFKAGPAYPGFMYVPISRERNKIGLTFSGSAFDKVVMSLAVVLVILVFEEVALKGFLLGRARRIGFRLVSFKVGRWWEKEDEE